MEDIVRPLIAFIIIFGSMFIVYVAMKTKKR